jgi:MFS transporter, SP family, arabinose:H+ symporter
MNGRKVLLWSVVVSMGGFLFGFDTAVISGAEQSIQKLWTLTPAQQGLTVSIALIGTIIGSLFGSIPADKFGRRKTLIIIAALYLLSAIGTSLSSTWFLFLLFRFLGGLSVGASSVTIPIYISEIAPAHKRGRLVALFQFNIVLGIVLSYFSNYLIGQDGETAWRWMLGVQSFPALLFLVLLQLVPESPRWLILRKGKISDAKAILSISNPQEYETEIISIKANKIKNQSKTTVGHLFCRQYRLPVFLAMTFAIFNQVSGINAIIYFAPRIFEMAGLAKNSSMLSTVGIGTVNFLFTLIAIRFIDKIGRKTLMTIGSAGLIITLALVAGAFYSRTFSGWSVTVYLFFYIAFFALSQGSVIWVFISEIFPNPVRAKGQTLGSTTHWIMASLIAFSFPMLIEQLGIAHTFLFFCIMMILQLLFVWKLMPETKGRSLEQIELLLAKLPDPKLKIFTND